MAQLQFQFGGSLLLDFLVDLFVVREVLLSPLFGSFDFGFVENSWI